MSEQSKLIDKIYKAAKRVGKLYRFSSISEKWDDVKKQEIGTGERKKTPIIA